MKDRIVFETTEMVVYRNDSGEIFVRSKEHNGDLGVEIRITPGYKRLTVSSYTGSGKISFPIEDKKIVFKS